MKLAKFFLLTLILQAVTLSAWADVTSVNVVGYVNLPIRPGDNLIANQLHNTNNSLNHLFLAGTPDGSLCAKWDSQAQQFLPLSLYSSNAGWSINYDLLPGEGALFHAPSAFTNTFVGEVPYDDGPIYTFPSQPAGTYLFSCSVPQQIGFEYIIGRAPLEDESVRRLDALAQSYFTTTYRNGAWDNGAPVLRVGESAFFTLMGSTTTVPEPGIYALLVGGGMMLGARRIFSRKRN